MSLREACGFIYHKRVQQFIIGVIIFNAICLGILTNKDLSLDTIGILDALDDICLYIFVIELVLKHLHDGFKFWKQPWNIFDFIIVAISFVPAGSSVSVLRGMRILRVLKLLSSIRSLQKIVTGLLVSLPGIGWLTFMILIIFYLFAVMGTNFFGEEFPEFFGSLGKSSYTLFQIMTLESWSMGIARPVIAKFSFAYIYFVVFILLSTFIMLNLFVGIIVSAMSYNSSDENTRKDKKDDNSIEEQITLLEKSLKEGQELLGKLKDSVKKQHSQNGD